VATEPNWRIEALAEYIDRHKCKVEEVLAAKVSIERATAVLKARELELAELENAARVMQIIPAQRSMESPSLVGADHLRAPGEHQPRVFKDLSVEVLRNAYPRSMKAIEIQAYIERKLAKKFHPKTAGMTLFRLSREGVVVRSRWTWTFVPEEHRNKATSPTAEEHETKVAASH
jgi:hypothetical protein